ncbi:unnamed protein product [Cylindrotheca closterium]|uniref:Uncharacterized protein n=1 Tax=Cylindrotheca closterium TaxID=2856 RepID=A0AAD2G2Y4_9STRA|nr:unnamed protein product [Cylindrotheca closterium]
MTCYISLNLAISVRLIKPGKHLKHVFFPISTSNQLKVGSREVALEGNNIEKILHIVSTQMGLESYRRAISSIVLDWCLSLSQQTLEDDTNPDTTDVDNEMGKFPSHFPEVYPNSSWSLYGLNEEGQIFQKICGSKDNQWNVLKDIDDWLHKEFYDDENDLTLNGMPYKGKWKWRKDNDYQLQKNNMLPSYLKGTNDELEQFRKERERSEAPPKG